jgi:hypothetical protein
MKRIDKRRRKMERKNERKEKNESEIHFFEHQHP